MKLSIKAGATSQTVNVFILDSSSTTGTGLSGLVFNTASLTAYYALPKAASVQITLATLAAITTAYSSGGFKEIDATNMKGWYRLDLPDAALASGRSVAIHLQGAANMAPCPIEIELTGWDNQDAVHGGMSALPNTACTTNASLLTSGTGTDQLSVTTGRIDIGKALGTAVTLDTNNVLNVSTKYLGGTLQTARDIGTSVLLSNGTGTGQLSLSSGAVLLQATQTGVTIPAVTTVGSVTGSVGSVTGAVGSVTGAVGSVTGNVGGNVVGSVASVTAAVTLSAGDSPVIVSGTASAGAAGTITLAGASTTANLYNGCLVKTTGGTGSGQVRTITAYSVGRVATVDYNWTTTPDNTTTYAVLATDNHALNSSLQVTAASVQGNVTGSVASVTGAVGSVTGAVGSITGVTFPTNFSSFSIDASGRVDIAKIKGTASAGAAGYVGLDWANITAPTTTVGLTGTTISSSQVAASVTGAVGSVTGSVGSVTGAVGSVTGAVGSVTGNVGGNVVGSVASVTAAVSLSTGDSPVIVSGTASAGAAGTITLAGASTTANFYNGCLVKTTGGTGSGQVRTITAYTTGRVATVDYNWTTSPDNTTTFAVLATDNHALNSSLQVTSASVQGNVTGSVGSVTGAVGSVTGSVGSVTGAVGSVTGNVGGNVVGTVASVVGAVGSITGVTFPTNFSSFSIDASGRVDIAKIKGTASAGAAGYVGLDWANITAPTTTVNLSGTTISTSQAVASVSGAVGSVTGAVGSVSGNIGGNVVGSVASVTGAVGSVTGAVGSVTGSVGSVTAAVTLSGADSPVIVSGTASAGGASTLTLTGASATDSYYNGCVLKTTGGTGSLQARTITAYVGSTKVATVDRAWTTTPDNTTTFTVLATDNAKVDSSLQTTAASVQGNVTGSVASVSGNVGGNVVGSVGSVTGAVGSVTGAVGSVTSGVSVTTNNDKTGYSLSVTPPTAATIATTVWQDLMSSSDFTTTGSIGKLLKDDINVALSTLSTYAGGDTSGTTTLLSRLTGTRATNLDNLDAAVTTRMATFTLPTNFADLAITATTGRIDVGKILGTTSTGAAGYVGIDWGQVTNKTTTNALTGTTISTSQAVASVSGAVGSVTGAVGSVSGNIGGNVVGSVASVTAAVTVGAYSAGQDPATLVLDVAASGHNTSLTIGNKINAAASAGDPWSTAVPGSYGAGTAGAVLGNLSAAADPWGITLPGSYGAGTAGKLLSDNLNATVSSRSTYAGADTSGTTTLLSRLTGTRATNLDNLDTAVSGRMATFTVPTNFADLAITATTGRVTAGTVSDKTGYSLSQSFPTNFADLAITAATGRVTAGTVSDKTGYSLSQAFPSNFSSLTINSGGGIDLYSIGTDASAAVGLKAMGQGSILCTVKSSPTSGSLFSIQAASGYTLSSSDSFYSTPDASLIVCTSGTNKGKTAKITGYTGSTGALTLSPGFPATPTANDEMFIIGFSN